MEEKLKLIEVTKKEFFVEVPKRLKENGSPSKVVIDYIGKEYVYTTRKSIFKNITVFTYEELIAIANKLKELNK